MHESSANLGSLYEGLVPEVAQNSKHLRQTRHTHHPVDDAKGIVDVLPAMKDPTGLQIRPCSAASASKPCAAGEASAPSKLKS